MIEEPTMQIYLVRSENRILCKIFKDGVVALNYCRKHNAELDKEHRLSVLPVLTHLATEYTKEAST